MLSSLALAVLLRLLARYLPRKPDPQASEPREGSFLAATWLFTLALVAAPFWNVGAHVPGGVAFRAYFSADLMTHLSVVAELQKGEFPLENPFYAGRPLGYYWLFFIFPAAAGGVTSNLGALLGVYVAGSLLFTGLFFVAARALGLGAKRAFLAAAIAVGAASYEGIFALGNAWIRAEPWTDLNVDAFSRWVFELTSLDGLHRSLLYTPQHLFSYSLLVVLVLLVLRGEPRGRASSVFVGVLLGAMAGTSIVTAMLAGPWLILVLFWRLGGRARFLEAAVWTTATALAFLAWYVALGFFGEAGSALSLRAPRALEPFSVLLLDAGALVLLIVLARRRRELFELEIALLAAMALAAVMMLDIRGYEGVWMAWRAGSVLLLALALLAAPALRGRIGLPHLAVLLPAALTVVLDVKNAQDVSNRRLSAGGFPWTTVVSREEWQALRWLRDETPERAVVQWDARARNPGEWALVPALAERRLAVGFPIFLLDLSRYRVRERRHVRPIFVAGDAERAHRLATHLGIDYLFVGRQEIRVRGERVRELFEAPRLFRPAFENEAVTILEVLPGS